MRIPGTVPTAECIDQVETMIRHANEAIFVLRQTIMDKSDQNHELAVKAAQAAVDRLRAAASKLSKGA